ncbi:uncharacterized protein BXZ73DRAFT_78943 [Epithele typhae]|uniref:uncharacterized protein n=1 Tax=Epithele typhae TaxID=378194 RepID=UPI002007CD00|nr:uncharacterized protein BXZ73DRAFT_78943 [Epithele typhae]KAH9925602.1 hypothetical protein BXZ73DRAFT_78943 [Epithele typhae]
MQQHSLKTAEAKQLVLMIDVTFVDVWVLEQPAPEHNIRNSTATISHPVSPMRHLHARPRARSRLSEDLRHFLRVLVPGRTPRSPRAQSDAVSACDPVRHKYEAEAVLQGALTFLKKYYVDSFDTWPRVDPPGRARDRRVNLARLTGTDALLPAALMGCCMLSTDELIRGFTLEDETGASREALGGVHAAGGVRGGVLELVDELRGHERVVCTLDWFKYWTDYIAGRRPADLRGVLQDAAGSGEGQHKDIWRRLPEVTEVTVEGWAADGPPPADANATPAE